MHEVTLAFKSFVYMAYQSHVKVPKTSVPTLEINACRNLIFLYTMY